MEKRSGLLFTIITGLFVAMNALAAPTMDRIYVQGYMRTATGSAVADGAYSMAFTLGTGTPFFTVTKNVTVTNGFFSTSLQDGEATSTGGITAALVQAAAAGQLAVNVSTTINSQATSFSIPAAAVPTALYATLAAGVVAGSIDATALATNAVTNVKILNATIADTKLAASGTMPAWDGSALTNIAAGNISSGTLADGRFPATLPAVSGANLTSLNGSNISSGTVAAARVDTGTTANKIVALNGSAQLPAVDGSLLTSLTAANITAGGTLPALNGAALTNVVATSYSGVLPIANGGTGSTATTLTADRIVLTNGTATGLIVDGCTIGQLLYYTGTTWACKTIGTGNDNIVSLNGSAQLPAVSAANLTAIPAAAITGIFPATVTLPAASATITQDAAASTALTLSTTNNQNIALAPNGTGTVDVGSKRITSLAVPTSATDAVSKAYVDAATAAALPMRFTRFLRGVGSVTGLVNVGWSATPPTFLCNGYGTVNYTTGTGAAGNYGGAQLGCTSSATAQNAASQVNGWRQLTTATLDLVDGLSQPDLIADIRTDASITSIRFVAGFSSGLATASSATNILGTATMSTQSNAYFRYEAGVDTNWQCLTCDGTACTTTIDSAVPVAANTNYVLRVRLTSSAANYYINNALVCSHSTNLPLGHTPLGYAVAHKNNAAAAVRMNYNFISLQAK